MKILAIILLSIVLVVAFFKFSLIINKPQAFCSMNSFAAGCHKTPDYSDYYQTLRRFSRAIPLDASILALVIFIIAFSLLDFLKTKITGGGESIFIDRRAPLNLARARKPLLHWISLHEGGSPATLL